MEKEELEKQVKIYIESCLALHLEEDRKNRTEDETYYEVPSEDGSIVFDVKGKFLDKERIKSLKKSEWDSPLMELIANK